MNKQHTPFNVGGGSMQDMNGNVDLRVTALPCYSRRSFGYA